MSSTTSDLALLRRKLAASDYSPDVYVKEMANRCVGGHELHLQRKNIQTLSEDTHTQLKKNVYENYGQFMTTAKEIAFLESEMYQLSHMITEQRNILQEMAETSLLGDKVPLSHDIGDQSVKQEEAKIAAKDDGKNIRDEFEEGRRQLYDLLERVEGCSHVTDVPTRYLLHDGDLVEMDITENAALHRVHGYLMNDSFMVATWLPNRRGPVRFKFSSLYEMDSLAVVNVRDLGGVKHAFKLLVFPDARLFQCANGSAKQVWMDAFENAKKRRQKDQETAALKRSDTITQKQRKRFTSARRKNPFFKGSSTESSRNPFNEEDEHGKGVQGGGEADHENGGEDDDQAESEGDFEMPEWILELPEDLEVFIAQREFEQAVTLIFKAEKYFTANSFMPEAREARNKLQQRSMHLVEVLKTELSEDKSVQGGPRAARRAVQLLCRLDRSALACQLFLQHRTAILKNGQKSVKLESATVPYIQRLSSAFFNSVMETSVEFSRAFNRSHPKKTSALLNWIETETSGICDKIEKLLFSPSTPLEVIASCVSFVREQACMLRDREGMDVTYLADAKFRRNVERTICEHRDKHVEAVKLRAQEDKWEPINCFNKAGTERFLEEMSQSGIKSVRSLVFDDCWVSLTRNTTSFSLSYLGFVNSLLKLFNPALRSLINESLVTVFHSHLRHVEQAVRSEKLKNTDPKFVQRNCAFLLDTLLSLVEMKYGEKTQSDCPKLAKLHSSYMWLKEGMSPAAAQQRVKQSSSRNTNGASSPSKPKFDDPNYV